MEAFPSYSFLEIPDWATVPRHTAVSDWYGIPYGRQYIEPHSRKSDALGDRRGCNLRWLQRRVARRGIEYYNILTVGGH
jgi:hypothetical protein